MPKRSTCIKVQKASGEDTRVLANEMKIINKELEIKKDDCFIYIPLRLKPSKTTLKTFKQRLINVQVTTRVFQEKPKKASSYSELLEGEIPRDLQAHLPHSVDIVGDIAIIELPPELQGYSKSIGEAILKAYRNVITVLSKASAVTGTYRLRKFEIIAGEHKTVTKYKENGCQFYVDVAKVYFSPRLSHERNRVSSLVKDQETVVDLFAGVGPFAIQIARKHENVKVYAVDVNPEAFTFMKSNVRLNRVDGKVHPILGDTRQVVDNELTGIADRVIMNLPEKAIDFMDAACKALKPYGGLVHFYCFVNETNSLETMQQRLIKVVEANGREIRKKLLSRLVRATAPYEWQAVLDLEII